MVNRFGTGVQMSNIFGFSAKRVDRVWSSIDVLISGIILIVNFIDLWLSGLIVCFFDF